MTPCKTASPSPIALGRCASCDRAIGTVEGSLESVSETRAADQEAAARLEGALHVRKEALGALRDARRLPRLEDDLDQEEAAA